ncbi:hypothetical protein [Vreelandella hamiltonii]|uniref:Uncharacterized protein n=1 Tax=Vreelandella hamiltonii TaxID=502829 RepID=A0A8H9IQI2_9GAMM|nr:hypothetical protein [Halomonas hamiltonii]GHD54383.1 hypothetical protein GCM10007157_02750 [Halomonas hamiltonii]
MPFTQLTDISQEGLQLAIRELREEMFDTPECDYTIAKLLCHCGQFEAAERHIDDMLLKWGTSPEVVTLTEKAYADMATLSAAQHAESSTAANQAMKATSSVSVAVA